MFRKKQVLRGMAVFMALEMLMSVFLPTITYALTAGPTAPEFSSFEPVDTTDMVNVATGDFVYNMPLLNVPGPEGGYSLSLSYHAGIKPAQEASWVGLGWTLNPGAINRVVNGASDDNYNTKQVVSDYWDGGSAKSTAHSIGVSIANTGVGINYGWVTTRDSNKGFSTKHNGLGVSINPVNAVMSSISQNTPSANTTGSSKQSNGSNYGTNINSIASSWLSSGTSMGVSTSTKGTNYYVSVAGNTWSTHNQSAGSVSSKTRGDMYGGGYPSVNIGIFTIGYDAKNYYTRYWSDRSSSLNTFGALYAKEANTYINGDDYINSESEYGYVVSYAYDNYNLYDPISNDISDENDPVQQLGGAFPSFDQYSVLGQGVSGSMEPYIFETGDLHGQNLYEKHLRGGSAEKDFPILEYKSINTFDKEKIDFRFKNDFSNSLKINAKTISDDGTNFSVDENQFELHDAIGFDNSDDNQHLAGSKNIEWYSNKEIEDGTATNKGLVDYYKGNSEDRSLKFELYDNYLQPEAGVPTFGFGYFEKGDNANGTGSFVGDTYAEIDPFDETDKGVRNYRTLAPKQIDLSKKIGGFKITNETGVTYHYTLPVYAYNEYTRIKTKNPHDEIVTFREEKRDEPYAYTWLLTAVTGPDYVDRNLDGVLNNDDWGYWVKFDYGRWADSYQWRTPHTGYHQDLENNYETFSYGIKELYYLDAIETRTHKALFVKSKRKDGKGVTSRLEGGSEPRKFRTIINYNCDYLEYNVSPVSTMKLDEIFIVDKNDIETLSFDKSVGTEYREATTSTPHIYDFKGTESIYAWNGPDIDNSSSIKVKYHNGDLVLDKYDIESIRNTSDGLLSKSLQSIQFNTDYSLAKETPNSFGTVEDHLRINDITFEHCNSLLSGDSFNGVNIIEDEFPVKWDAQTNCMNWDPFLSGCQLNIMDFYGSDPLFKFDQNSCYDFEYSHECEFFDENGDYQTDKVKNYFGSQVNYYNLGKLTLKSVKVMGKQGADLLPATQFAYDETKNFDYNKDAFDEWQYYKSNFDGEGYTRRRDTQSANNVDAWSLSTITTPIGSSINIEYESDDYDRSVINDELFLSIKDIKIDPTPLISGSGIIKIEFEEKGLPLGHYFSINDKINPNVYLLSHTPYVAPTYIRLPNGSSYENTPEVNETILNTLIHGGVEQVFTYDLLQGTTEKSPIKLGHIGDYLVTSVSANSIHFKNENLYNIAASDDYIDFIHGYIKVANNQGVGDGLRVKQLNVVDDFSNNTYTTSYNYDNPSTSISSGVTAYQPYKSKTVKWSNKALIRMESTPLIKDMTHAQSIEYNKAIVKWSKDYYGETKFGEILALARELPGPGIIYEYVTTSNYINGVKYPSKKVDHFQVFNKEMVSYSSSYFTNTATKESKEIVIENKTSSIGNLLSSETFDDEGKPLMSSFINYLNDNHTTSVESQILATNQGKIEQSFHQNFVYKKYNTKLDDGRMKVTLFQEKNKAQISKRVEYTDVNTGQTTTNHKTGITTTSKNLAFDFFSGHVTKTLSTDSYGNTYVSETVPAYQVTSTGEGGFENKTYSGMGLGMYGGKNMLTQNASTVSYKVNPDDINDRIGLVGASAQTWSDQTEVLGEEVDYDFVHEVTINSSNSKNISVITDKTENLSIGDHIQFGYILEQYLGTIIEDVSTSTEKKFKVQLHKGFSPILSSSTDLYMIKQGVPRKKATYSWLGNDQPLQADGLYPFTNFTEFDAWNDGIPTSEQWQKNGEITLYNVYSHALEAKDVNGNYAATKMDPKQEKVIATVANASYHEMAYSGAEHMLATNIEEDGVNNGDGFTTTAITHTGKYSLQVAYGDEGFNYRLKNGEADLNKKYVASVWVYLPGESETEQEIAGAQLYYIANGIKHEVHPQLQKNKSKSWYLLELEIDPLGGVEILVGCQNNTSRNVYFDDFRVHPLDAAMTSYVYDDFSGELTYILDANNFYTHFEYDGMGRLVRSSRELLNFDYGDNKESYRADKILNETIYNYGGTNE